MVHLTPVTTLELEAEPQASPGAAALWPASDQRCTATAGTQMRTLSLDEAALCYAALAVAEADCRLPCRFSGAACQWAPTAAPAALAAARHVLQWT
jgi:hypothetical protein